jgi:hypothetical protein
MCAEDGHGDLCTILKMFDSGKLELRLEKSGTGFFVGSSPTIADCSFLPVVRQVLPIVDSDLLCKR